MARVIRPAAELRIPKLRKGSYFLLEPRRLAERALAAVVQEAYVHEVSTRLVVKAMGMTGMSKSQVSRLRQLYSKL
jgi:putative transposase